MSYLPNMPADHEYISKYNQNQAVFVVGQGAWENECQNDLRKLADVLHQKGIHASINFWGYDIPHDWPSWERQISLYLPGMV